MRRSAERAEAKAAAVEKDAKKADVRADPKAHQKDKEAQKMKDRAAELKRLAAGADSGESSRMAPKMGMANEDDGRVFLSKGKGKSVAPSGSVTADLGF